MLVKLLCGNGRHKRINDSDPETLCILAGGMGAAKVYEDESIIWTPTVSVIGIKVFLP